MLQRALHQEIRVHESGVGYVFFRRQTAPVEIFVNLLRLCDVGEISRGGRHARGDAG